MLNCTFQVSHSDYVKFTLPWFRRMVTSLSSVGLNLNSRAVHLVIVVDKMVLVEVIPSTL